MEREAEARGEDRIRDSGHSQSHQAHPAESIFGHRIRGKIWEIRNTYPAAHVLRCTSWARPAASRPLLPFCFYAQCSAFRAQHKPLISKPPINSLTAPPPPTPWLISEDWVILNSATVTSWASIKQGHRPNISGSFSIIRSTGMSGDPSELMRLQPQSHID